MKRAILFILVAALAVCMFAGCGGKAEQASSAPSASPEQTAEATTRTVTDMVGRTVEIPTTVERICPLANTPRMITYLGLSDKAVAISGFDKDTVSPVTAYAYASKDFWADLPVVGTDGGGATDYYPEEIIAANPDVILCSYAADLADEIQTKTGIPVVAVATGTLFGEDYNEALRLLGDVCNVPERAEAVISYLDDCLSDLDARTANVAADGKPTVLAAAATFKGAHGIEGVSIRNALLNAVAANDVSVDLSDKASSMIVDKEQILKWNPQIIFLDSAGVPLVKTDYAADSNFYKQLTAFQNKSVYQYPSSTSYYSNLEISLANCYFIGSILYPEQFKDVSYEEKANEIFKFFLGIDNYLDVLDAAGFGYVKVDFGA